MDRNLPAGVLVVRSGRNPHTICLVLGLVGISLYGLFFTTPSVSLDSGLAPWQRFLFAALSMSGAVLVLIGIYWPRLLAGMLLERIGQMLLAVGATVYVIVLCTVSTFDRSGLVTVFALSVAFGSAWRAIHLTRRDLPVVRRAMERLA